MPGGKRAGRPPIARTSLSGAKPLTPEHHRLDSPGLDHLMSSKRVGRVSSEESLVNLCCTP
ncbi:hypothetical protein [Lentzea waywayandensis]|uniref:hypothetical protein n=1 Tax=Lentzea waywayandensis TaxID=84724 RepID=UPI001FE8A2A7|nr:hypothetical protein [Lentzea waywayandensis]